MKIYPVSAMQFSYSPAMTGNKKKDIKRIENNRRILNEIYNISNLNKANIHRNNAYSLGLSHDELLKRTGKDELYTYIMLNVNSPEFEVLEEGDKKAAKHLLKAGKIIDGIQLEIDDSNNIPFRDYLNSEIDKGNEDAKMTKTLFDAQKGIFALDNNGEQIALAKGLKHKNGLGLYPSDLSVEEFHSILIKMLKEGKTEEVRKILNQRSFVERDEDELKAVDYVDKFKEEFTKAADELEKAAETSTNEDFNEYLKLQAKALREADPMLDAYADIKWATLQDTPLEFTITREGYDDQMTMSVLDNEELRKMLEENNIEPLPKDSLGARVGIVNKESTDKILKFKDYLPLIAKNMPFSDSYKQDIADSGEIKQAIVDADILALYGDVGACRAGIYVAENLPNDDKIAVNTLNGGKRNVYHRQIMQNMNSNYQKFMDAVVDPKFHKYYSDESNLLFTVGHENGHTLGPSETSGLGKHASTIEENKADLVSILFTDILNKEGFYSDKTRDEILFYFVMDSILKTKPLPSQQHRTRSLMQFNYLRENGAVSVSDKGFLSLDFNKIIPASMKMLNDVIEIQLSNNPEKAAQFIERYSYWSDDSERMAQNLRKVLKSLNATTETPLADKLLAE